MWKAGNESTQINIVDPEGVKRALGDLNNTTSSTNWVSLGYGEGKNDIILVDSGSGGIEEVKNTLSADKILFVIVEVVVTGDKYNPLKHVFISWIGRDVPAGISKARSAGHRHELIDFVKDVVSISCEYQTDQLTEISYDPIAQSITRMRPAYGSSTEVSATRKEMSAGKSGGTPSKLIIMNEASVVSALKSVFLAEKDWAILAYVIGKKDEVELVKTGVGGIQSLKNEFPADRIYFCLLRITVKTSGRDTLPKFIIVTMVGNTVKPLQKARSAGQRQDISDFILLHVPFHTHYQPGSANELTEQAIMQLLN